MPCDISHSDILLTTIKSTVCHTLKMVGEKVFHNSIHQPTLRELLRLQKYRSNLRYKMVNWSPWLTHLVKDLLEDGPTHSQHIVIR